MGETSQNRFSELRMWVAGAKASAEIVGNRERRMKMYERKEFEEKANRKGRQYIEYLRGLQYCFEFIRRYSLLRIMDAGAGTGKATSELENTLGRGLEFVNLGMNGPEDKSSAKLSGNYIVSDFETVKGLKRGSFGGIISVFGAFNYSPYPNMVIRKADRLLAPGGLVKFVNQLDHRDAEDYQRDGFISAFESYLEGFKKFGYSVAQSGLEEAKAHSDHITANGIFLAIKPSSEQHFRDFDAENLLVADRFSVAEQLQEHELLMKNKE